MRRVALSVLVACLVPTAALAAFATTDAFIPSVGHWPGANESYWYATIWVHNPTSESASVQFYMLKRDQANPSPTTYNDTIAAGATKRYDDAILTMFGETTVGAVRVVSDRKLIVTARSYSTPPGGADRDTTGQLYSAIPASFAIGTGQSTVLIGNMQEGTDSEFRYNFGFVETTGNDCIVMVEVVSDAGHVFAYKAYPIKAYEALQYNWDDLHCGGSNISLRISLYSGNGKVIAFGSGIANRSNDPSTFEMSFPDALLAGGSSVQESAGER